MNIHSNKPNILVVCGRNKKRSRSAEHIYKNDSRFHIKSAGLSALSEVVINAKMVEWADVIVVMENAQKNRIQSKFKGYNIPKIINIDIPDNYAYLEPALIDLLQEKMEPLIDGIFDN